MDLVFCDLCSESVPLVDIEQGRATRVGERVVCSNCNAAMGEPAAQASGAGGAPGAAPDGGPPAQAGATEEGKEAEGAEAAARRSDRRLPSAGLTAATLLLCGVAATLFLIVRIEQVAKVNRETSRDIAEELRDLRRNLYGMRDRVQNEVRRELDDMADIDVVKLDRVDRTLEAIRKELGLPPDGTDLGPGRKTPREREAAEVQARIEALEEQVLFLQSQLFELEEREDGGEPEVGAVDDPPPAEPRVVRDEDPELEALLERLRHPDPAERAGALFTLGQGSGETIARHVALVLEDPDPFLRATAARTLERLDARESVPSLIAALADADPTVRDAVVSALRGLTGRAFLFDPRATATERDYAVRRWQDWWDANWKDFLYG